MPLDKVDFLIVGQGIAGTMMAHHLIKRGASVHVVDDGHKSSSSTAAAGIINPITGRKYVKSWRTEDFIPYARLVYRDLSSLLDIEAARDVYIYRALYSPEDENTFLARSSDEKASQFIHTDPHTVEYEGLVKGVLSYGVVKGGMQVNLPLLLRSFRQYLKNEESLTEETFEYDAIKIDEHTIRYKDILASNIVFSEGFKGRENPYFGEDIRYEPVKGEALIVHFPEHTFSNILRHKIFIAPIADNKYWIGSGYEWDFTDDQPSDKERSALVEKLDSMIDIPYRIVNHLAGIRPSVKERKPRLGRHPRYSHMYCFNGMGTKGSSLSPYWAKAMTEFILDDNPLDREVNLYI